jgi:hypothetical protein
MVSSVNRYRLQETFAFESKNELKVDRPADLKSVVKEKNKKKPSKVIKSRGKYSCAFCEKTFKRQDRLDRHTFTHTKEVIIHPPSER